jgi:hypothetical protein
VSKGRFGLLLALLFAVLASASFLIVFLLLESDDDEPGATTTSTTFSITTTTSPGAVDTPAFIAIVVSERDESVAGAMRDQLTEDGFDSGVLRSDDHASLEPGFWVAYVGPFDEVGGAQAAVADLQAAGYTAAYPRCVGTTEECA